MKAQSSDTNSRYCVHSVAMYGGRCIFFLRMNAVENQQDFNLFTLVPQDATAILETDRMADLMEDINGLYCSKDDISSMFRIFLSI